MATAWIETPIPSPAGLVTFAQLEQLPDAPDFRYELHHGTLVKVPPPKHQHNRIQHNLLRLFWAALGDKDAGEAAVEMGFRALPDHEYRVADVAWLSSARCDRMLDGYLLGSPELVVEVLSPSNSVREISDKEHLCLESGSLEFWTVDPVRLQVKVSTVQGGTRTYTSGQRIPLLFGGTIAVDDIFRRRRQ